MINKVHAATVAEIFREMGHDAQVVEIGNESWAVTVVRHDQRVVCSNDEAVGLYESEKTFLDGTEIEAISF